MLLCGRALFPQQMRVLGGISVTQHTPPINISLSINRLPPLPRLLRALSCFAGNREPASMLPDPHPTRPNHAFRRWVHRHRLSSTGRRPPLLFLASPPPVPGGTTSKTVGPRCPLATNYLPLQEGPESPTRTHLAPMQHNATRYAYGCNRKREKCPPPASSPKYRILSPAMPIFARLERPAKIGRNRPCPCASSPKPKPCRMPTR